MNEQDVAMGNIVPPSRIASDKPHEAAKFPLDLLRWVKNKVRLGRPLEFGLTLFEVGGFPVSVIGNRIEPIALNKGSVKVGHRDFDLLPRVQRHANRGVKGFLGAVPSLREGRPVPRVGHGWS
jgi:hypothetical protein